MFRLISVHRKMSTLRRRVFNSIVLFDGGSGIVTVTMLNHYPFIRRGIYILLDNSKNIENSIGTYRRKLKLRIFSTYNVYMFHYNYQYLSRYTLKFKYKGPEILFILTKSPLYLNLTVTQNVYPLPRASHIVQ